MKEVYPNIFLIKERGSFGVIKPPENVYILAGQDGLIYDAGYGNKKTVKYLIKQIKKIEEKYKTEGKEFKITRVLPSHAHPDHFAGLKLLKKYLGVNIVLTDKMAKIIRSKKDFKKFFEPDPLKDFLTIRSFGQRIIDKIEWKTWRFFYYKIYGLSFIKDPDLIIEENCELEINGEKWRVFPSPGHSPDHISLYSEEKGILFSGDNVLRSITTWLGPPHCDIDDYIKSIEYIKSLPNLKLILPSHGSPFENPRQRIEEILNHRKERYEQVLSIIRENKDSGVEMYDIVDILYPGVDKIMRNTARGWICLTLKKLELENKIRRSIEKKRLLFFPVE
ncbi:MAG: MBL fold metallo-hydrolase [Promethearchaeota archaeon]